jgi:hypothetical protein
MKRLVTLSKLWNTIEFLHIAIATALFPNARQYVLINSLLEFGKAQIDSRHKKLTK